MLPAMQGVDNQSTNNQSTREVGAAIAMWAVSVAMTPVSVSPVLIAIRVVATFVAAAVYRIVAMVGLSRRYPYQQCERKSADDSALIRRRAQVYLVDVAHTNA